jgi:hypothetical protein
LLAPFPFEESLVSLVKCPSALLLNALPSIHKDKNSRGERFQDPAEIPLSSNRKYMKRKSFSQQFPIFLALAAVIPIGRVVGERTAKYSYYSRLSWHGIIIILLLGTAEEEEEEEESRLSNVDYAYLVST